MSAGFLEWNPGTRAADLFSRCSFALQFILLYNTRSYWFGIAFCVSFFRSFPHSLPSSSLPRDLQCSTVTLPVLKAFQCSRSRVQNRDPYRNEFCNTVFYNTFYTHFYFLYNGLFYQDFFIIIFGIQIFFILDFFYNELFYNLTPNTCGPLPNPIGPR